MPRRVSLCAIGLSFALAVPPANAGVPRGLVLSADEQSAGATDGSTIARGNAEIAVPDYAIAGRADVIEILPQRKQIVFKGRVTLAVGKANYAGDTVVCGLDFDHCTADATDEPPPLAAAAEMTPR